jgi:hypothetical protein
MDRPARGSVPPHLVHSQKENGDGVGVRLGADALLPRSGRGGGGNGEMEGCCQIWPMSSNDAANIGAF